MVLYLFSREFMIKNPRFSFLFSLFSLNFFWISTLYQSKIDFFTGYFDLESHGREFNLIHYFRESARSWNSFFVINDHGIS